jgi:CcmD family protein
MNQGQPANPDDRAMGFSPVKGGQETSSAEGLLVTAYLVMWALLFGFLFLGWRRQGQVEKRLGALERSVDGGKAPPS